jgi:hypothetical protein
MNKKVKITIAIIACAILVSLFWFGINIGGGSYTNAEKYELNVSDSSLISAIKKFKNENPQYNVPVQTQLTDSIDKTGHWFHIYFYYPEENQIINTWTRNDGKNKTTFAFVGVNEGLTLGNWKEINRDFTRSENKEQKKKFEERILNKLKY